MNHREKKRKIIITTLSIICIAVLSLTIAYAALSETLTISGSGTVTATDWDISLAKTTSYTNKVTGGASYTEPLINETTISYSVNLTRPGDSVTLYAAVKNDGDLNGAITSIASTTPTCTSSTGNTADASLVCDNLDVTITYANGTTIKSGDAINTDDVTCYNGSTYGYQATVLKIVVSLKDTMTSVPSSTVTLSNMKHEVIYSQSNKICQTQSLCFVAGTKVLTENGYKAIEEIKEGDYVYTKNLENNQIELNKVSMKLNSYTSELFELTVAGEVIKTTRKHQFYIIDKGWVRAEDLVIGDKISSEKDVDTTITKIEIKQLDERLPVYNMEMEGHHNYLITENKLLVHNATGSPT